ncbi:hypothetical protein WR25_13759 [Diploscapter pachys]|uniref:Uncharacterized protein n=1 Tax=Diploscapter pachys TaxID=2018661 RepID=A0A2A2K4E3_9BILA|nr:hypothetical protein WR25_13759 [Diploscapter pachys]
MRAARGNDPAALSEESMSRTTLGLFGAARPRPVAQDRLIATSDTAADAYRAERLSGLTPVERALAEPKDPFVGPALAAPARDRTAPGMGIGGEGIREEADAIDIAVGIVPDRIGARRGLRLFDGGVGRRSQSGEGEQRRYHGHGVPPDRPFDTMSCGSAGAMR